MCDKKYLMSNYIPDEDRYDGRMPYRKCGRWGLKLPSITLGFWHNFGGNEVTSLQKKIVYTAFDRGITHFDLANNYGPPYGSAEQVAGSIMKDLPRHEIVVSSKAGYDMWPGPYGEWGSRKYLINSLDQSLNRLDMDYVDVFYSHRFDPETPLEETLSALNSAVVQGKALYSGISSYNTEQTIKASKICKENGWAPIIIHQPNYSMFNRWIEKSLLDSVENLGMGVIAFCPLYQGLLTDKYLNNVPSSSRAAKTSGLIRESELSESVLNCIRNLNKLAIDRGQSLAQMALSWVLRDKRVTSALIGASSPEQVIENSKCVENCVFSADEEIAINELLSQIALPESLWAGE